MTLPTPDQIRSRQTAYLATEAWWKTRVEDIAAQFRADARFWRERLDRLDPVQKVESTFAESRAGAFVAAADTLDALLAERPSR